MLRLLLIRSPMLSSCSPSLSSSFYYSSSFPSTSCSSVPSLPQTQEAKLILCFASCNCRALSSPGSSSPASGSSSRFRHPCKCISSSFIELPSHSYSPIHHHQHHHRVPYSRSSPTASPSLHFYSHIYPLPLHPPSPVCCFSSLIGDTNSNNFSDGVLRTSKKSSSKAIRTVYVCDHCGESFAQWWGKCNSCKMSGSLKKLIHRDIDEEERGGGGPGLRAAEMFTSNDKASKFPESYRSSQMKLQEGLLVANNESFGAKNDSSIVKTGSEKHQTRRSWLLSGSGFGPRPLTDVSRGNSEAEWRIPLVGSTGMEIARVLGGGLAPGSIILVGGDPGVGKSTLLLQLSGMLAEGCEFYERAPVLYVSGEESEEQIGSRADRIGISSSELYLYSATDLEAILDAIQQLRPRAVIIDSIQTIYLPQATGSAGSVIQVRECAAALQRLAKRTNIPIFLVGHVTRSGDIAGPRVLEHIVDVVLYLEGENRFAHRILRVVKNRFGSTDEVGVFEMAKNGMVAVENPSQLFLDMREEERNGFSGAIAVTMEGSRPFLVEIQALCSGSSNVVKHVNVNGLDPQRLHLILAVLSKLAGVKAQNQNVIISVVGGLQVKEPAVDLAVAVALCSSYYDRRIPADMAFIGEIGLGGEIRSVRQLDRRILEVSKLGFRTCIVPKVAQKAFKACADDTVKLIACATLQEVVTEIVLQSFSA